MGKSDKVPSGLIVVTNFDLFKPNWSAISFAPFIAASLPVPPWREDLCLSFSLLAQVFLSRPGGMSCTYTIIDVDASILIELKFEYRSPSTYYL